MSVTFDKTKSLNLLDAAFDTVNAKLDNWQRERTKKNINRLPFREKVNLFADLREKAGFSRYPAVDAVLPSPYVTDWILSNRPRDPYTLLVEYGALSDVETAFVKKGFQNRLLHGKFRMPDFVSLNGKEYFLER